VTRFAEQLGFYSFFYPYFSDMLVVGMKNVSTISGKSLHNYTYALASFNLSQATSIGQGMFMIITGQNRAFNWLILALIKLFKSVL
jgi:hypothetical protein